MSTENNPAPENPPAPAPAPVPAAPPAGKAVTEGKTEREIALENQLALESTRAKNAERIAAEWQDQHRQLKDLQTNNPPAPVKKKKRGGLRLTLLHPDPDAED